MFNRNRHRRPGLALVMGVTLGWGGLAIVTPLSGAVPAGATAPPNIFAPTGPMSVDRTGHTATTLADGRVLVAGGGSATAEVFDPGSGTFTSTNSMSVSRTDATATLLADGKVLVAGGENRDRGLSSAELYDPTTGQWSPTGRMRDARSGHTATLLPDGDVLVAGGACNGHRYGCNTGSFLVNQRSAELYHPNTGKWTSTGSMRVGREFQTGTLLQSGEVLEAGGFNNCDDDFCSDVSSVELYNPGTGKWRMTGSMRAEREQHTATLLPSGQVLVAGGLDQGGFGTPACYRSAELYDPASGEWTLTASMADVHVGQTATLVANGWVLISGGRTAATELYQPGPALWVSPGPLSTVRTDAAAALLADGRVLVTGGTGPDGQAQASAEVYTPGIGPLVSITPRTLSFGGQQVGTTGAAQTVTVTNDGSADLDVAGITVSGAHPKAISSPRTSCPEAPVAPGETCAVSVSFAPKGTGPRDALVGVADDAPLSPQDVAVSGYGGGPETWVPTGSMTDARDDSTATLLTDGKVLVAGGEDGIGDSLSSAELYDPDTRSFTPTGSLNASRAAAAATRLQNGDVLVTGGQGPDFTNLASAEIYDPGTGTWSPTGSMHAAGYSLTSTLMMNGDVLVTGMQGDSAEVFDPATGSWSDTGPMTSRHFFATATLLPQNGDVLVAGGGTAAAELYDPATNSWTATGSLHVARQGGTATLLPNNQVLVAGGDPPGGGNSLTSAELYDPATRGLDGDGIDARGPLRRVGHASDRRPGTCDRRLHQPMRQRTHGRERGVLPLPCRRLVRRSGDDPSARLPGRDAPFGRRPTRRRWRSCLREHDGIGDGRALHTDSVGRHPWKWTGRPARHPQGKRVLLPAETVRIAWDFTRTIEKVTTSSDGTFVVRVKVPRTAPGSHTIVATGEQSFAGARAPFTVTS